jgi:hypothetical protein
MLLDHGADKNARNNFGDSALHFAANRHHLETARALIKRGADLSIVNNQGSTPLHWVLHEVCHSFCNYANMVEMTMLLVRAGADVNAGDGYKSTPFMLLIEMPTDELDDIVPPQFELLVLMIEHGANINATGLHHFTPLHTAALRGDISMVIWLVSIGADYDIANDHGQTVFETLASPIREVRGMEGRPKDTESLVQMYRRRYHPYHELFLHLLHAVREAMYTIPRDQVIMMATAPRSKDNSLFHTIPDALIHQILGHSLERPPYNSLVRDVTFLRLKAGNAITPAPWPVLHR